MIKDEKVDLHF